MPRGSVYYLLMRFVNTLAEKVQHVLSSRAFYLSVLVFFVFESLWLVFSAVYPMAFDEDVHFGIIKLYAHYGHPFLPVELPGSEQFGAVARDPSFLYQYLMSYVYGFFSIFTHNEVTQIVLLRLVNVAMAVVSLPLFAKLMRKLGVSSALTNITLAIYVLIPVVPLLAAQINYDNLVLILVPLVCLAAIECLEELKNHRIVVHEWLLMFLMLGLMVLVKYAMLPFVGVFVLALAAASARYVWGEHRKIGRELKSSWRKRPKLRVNILLAILLLGLVMGFQRYGINLARYHSLVPKCDKVLSIEKCMHYGPWQRDYVYTQEKPSDFVPDKTEYSQKWVVGMWHRLYFAVDGRASNYANFLELPGPSRTALFVAIISAGATGLGLIYFLRRNIYVILIGSAVLAYIVVLFINGYGAYNRTGVAVAINGRYLLPVIPILAILPALVLSRLLRASVIIRSALATFVLMGMLYGGGVMTFIIRSQPSWYWHNHNVQYINQQAQIFLKKYIREGKTELEDPEIYK